MRGNTTLVLLTVAYISILISEEGPMKIKAAVSINQWKNLSIPDVFIHNLFSKLLNTLKMQELI